MSSAIDPRDEQFLSATELSKRWGVTKRTLHNMRERKEGPEASMFIKEWRYRLSDIVAYENAGKAAPTEPKGQ